MKKIKIVEVGPRDGLQNEKKYLDNDTRIEFIQNLLDAGLKNVEVGAFVSAEKIPQMRGSAEILKSILQKNSAKTLSFPVLVPNEKGMFSAIQAGAREIAIFTACSESFNQANINCSIAESFERFLPVISLAKKHKIKVRGYISTAFYCPYEGKIKPNIAATLSKKLLKLGCYEVSIGDTIGAATPADVSLVLKKLKIEIKSNKIAMHFHDTRGTAIANVVESLRFGVRIFDSSLGGLGGCPYAPGAQGNVSTEDLVYVLHEMGYKTGVNLPKLIETSHWLAEKMEKALPSKLSRAGLPKT